MVITEHEYLGRALVLLARGLESFVHERLQPLLLPTMSWTDLLAKRDEMNGRIGGVYKSDDVQALLRVITENLGALNRPFDTDLGRAGSRLAGELRETRNAWAHSHTVTEEDAYRAVDSVQRLLAIVGADQHAGEAAELRRQLQRRMAAETSIDAPPPEREVPPAAPALAPVVDPLPVVEIESSPHSTAVTDTPHVVDIEITCTPVISYAMAHNRLNVISQITLTSSETTARGVKLSVGVETAAGPLGEPREYFVDLAAGAETLVPRLDITVDPAAMLTVEDARPARVVATLSHDGRTLGRQVVEVTLLAAYQWLAQPALMSLEMLAAHVQPNHPALVSLIEEAAARLEATTDSGAFVGYQKGAERVDETAAAIIAAMRARDIRYSVPPASWTDDGQKVRTPDEVLAGRLGTCLDTAVVLAAALERVGIRPLLVVVEGHAFLGYWREEESLASPAMTGYGAGAALVNLVRTGYIALVETTLLTADFADVPLRDIQREPLEKHLTGTLDEVIGVTDVYQARRSQVTPLPARTVDDTGAVTVVEYQPGHSRPAAYVAAQRTDNFSTEARPIPPRVQLWKNALLDLSLRNSLINFSDRARFPLAVASDGLAEFEDALNGGAAVTLLASDELPAVQHQRGIQRGRDLPSDDRIDLFRARHELYTDVTAESYPRTLRQIAYKAKTVRDETGANNLYVAIGSLVWKVNDKQIRSPLILVPVTLASKGKTGSYSVSLDDAGVSTPNYCLLEKLRAEHGLVIPDLAQPAQDASGLDIDAALMGTRNALLAAGIEAFVEDTVDLAVLQFAKFRLWKDLDENWETLAENALVRHLIETPTDPFIDPVNKPFDDERSADRGTVDLDELLAQLPVSADSSQLGAVAAAITGRTFVLEGPPGTGKSQTITNLLAKAVSDGKRVLFVAEKRAALEVVQRRLESVGLGPYTLDLHDKGSRPAALRAHLHAALMQRTPPKSSELTRAVEGMDVARRRLARYTARVHEASNSGFSYYSARNDELRTSGVRHALPVGEATAGSLDPDQQMKIRAALLDLPDHEARARPRINHPWSFVDNGTFRSATPHAISDVVTAFDRALDTVWAFEGASDLLASADTAHDVRAAASIFLTSRTDDSVLSEVRSTRWATEVTQLEAEIQQLPHAFSDVYAVANADVLALDLDRILAESRAADASGFFGRKKRRQAVLDQVIPLLRPGATIALTELSTVAGRMLELRDTARRLASRVDALLGLRAPADWNPMRDSSQPLLAPQVEWLSWLAMMTNTESGAVSTPAFRQAAKTYVTSVHAADPAASAAAGTLADALDQLHRMPATTDSSWLNWSGGRTFINAWRSSRPGRDPGVGGVGLADWMRWMTSLEPLRENGLDAAYDELLTGRVPSDDALEAFERGLAAAALAERARSTGLDDFDPIAQTSNVARYTAAARDVRQHLPRAISRAVVDHRSFSHVSARGRAGELVAHVGKQRGRLSVRELMTRYGDLITEITPCVLVSPDSVARFFPAQSGLFDIVVFDEASQVRVADAVGAMGRGTSVVIVGDSKQMPPTSFAESNVGDDDDEESQVAEVLARDEESILAQCKDVRIESRWLSWHYRSQDESLIAFSNRAYYDDQLTSFPAPAHGIVDQGAHGHGVALRRLDGTFLRAGMGASRAMLRTNPVEAHAIVEEIRLRFAAHPGVMPSVGVVTFNAQQRTLIESLLRDTGDERIAEALDAVDGLFVKNLENVQGDERDTILFSAAFSKNEKGVLPLNFGPLTNHGGERRLNVAITRARRQVIVFASFDPSDLRVEQTASQGIRDLRAYMELAERGADRVLGVTAAASTIDLHREDIAQAMRDRGVTVTTDVGLSDFKVDLAVAPGRGGSQLEGTPLPSPIMAILLDGPMWGARTTVADRDALPVEVLSGLMKWPMVERVWLPEWIADRESVLDRLIQALGEIDAGAEPSGSEGTAVEGLQHDTSDGTAKLEPEASAPREPDLLVTPPGRTPASSNSISDPTPKIAGVRRRAERQIDHEQGVPFVPWLARVAGPRTMLDALDEPDNQRAVRTIIKDVVKEEGPVTEARLVRLVAGSFGLQRVHEERRKAITDLVPFRFRRAEDLGTYWPVDAGPSTWTGFRTATLNPERSLEAVPLAEISNAMVGALGTRREHRSEVMRDTLRTFGGNRMTPAITERIEAALMVAIRSRRVKAYDDGTLAAPGEDGQVSL